MTTTDSMKVPHARTGGDPHVIDSDLSLDFLRVVEQAAIACAHTMGQGDRHKSDQVAVEAMRHEMDSVPIDGTIVIGEGERDEAPMLYIGEKVGMAAQGRQRPVSRRSISRSIRSRAPTCAPPARPTRMAVLAASEQGGLLHAPDLYMEKLVVGPSSQRRRRSRRAGRGSTCGRSPSRSGRRVEDLVVIVLDRPRHEKLIDEIRADRRAHPADWRRRSVGGHHRGGGRQRRARRDGHRRRPRRRADRCGDAVP